MARPRKIPEYIEACNKDDLIIDVVSDVIQRDIKHITDKTLTQKEAIEMRFNFDKLQKVVLKYNGIKEAENATNNNG